MNIDQVEIILLMGSSAEGKDDGAAVWIERDLFAINAHVDCVLIGAISQKSQAKSEMYGEYNLETECGTHSARCSFNDVLELFGPDLFKLRIIDASVATFPAKNQFEIPHLGKKGFLVEAMVESRGVTISGLNGNPNDDLLKLIAMEAVIGVTHPTADA
jgi:hypothetical protein